MSAKSRQAARFSARQPSLQMTRREALLGAAAALAAAGSARADDAIGEVVQTKGKVLKAKDQVESALSPGQPLINNDVVKTRRQSFAAMKLGSDTTIHMGEEAELVIDHFIAEQGGTLELVSGDMVFDRPEGLPKIDLTLRTTFGQIGVRGTKFFTGMSNGKMAVFVEHGAVDVTSGKTMRRLSRGEGVDIALDDATRAQLGGDISAVKRWGKKRIEEAYRKVGLL